MSPSLMVPCSCLFMRCLPTYFHPNGKRRKRSKKRGEKKTRRKKTISARLARCLSRAPLTLSPASGPCLQLLKGGLIVADHCLGIHLAPNRVAIGARGWPFRSEKQTCGILNMRPVACSLTKEFQPRSPECKWKQIPAVPSFMQSPQSHPPIPLSNPTHSERSRRLLHELPDPQRWALAVQGRPGALRQPRAQHRRHQRRPRLQVQRHQPRGERVAAVLRGLGKKLQELGSAAPGEEQQVVVGELLPRGKSFGKRRH